MSTPLASVLDMPASPSQPDQADGRPGLRTVLRLAAGGGPSDRVRIALTAAGAAAAVLALLAAATVAAIGENDGPYTSALLNEPGLHPGVVAALVLLCVPVLTFTGQCARIGAPARDRRLATLRLIGATPSDVRRIAGAETALAALIGAVAGLGIYLIGRTLLDTPVVATRRVEREELLDNGDLIFSFEQVTGPALRLPTDVLPPWWVLAVIVLAVPFAAGVAGQIALRRVTLTPFGLVRNADVRPVRVLPLIAFIVGAAGMALFSAIVRQLEPPASAAPALSLLFLGLFVLALFGLILGTAALASSIGGFIAPRTGRPAVLIAARRLRAAPHDASRANAAVLAVVMVAAAVQGFREHLLLETINNGSDVYATGTSMALLALLVGGIVAALGLLVGAVESVLTRRRTLAALVAAGTPRGVLRRAVLLEVLLPLTPAVLVSTAVGALAARGLFGTTVTTGGAFIIEDEVVMEATVLDVPVPWLELSVIAGLAFTATTLLTLAVMPLLTRTLDPTELRTT